MLPEMMSCFSAEGEKICRVVHQIVVKAEYETQLSSSFLISFHVQESVILCLVSTLNE